MFIFNLYHYSFLLSVPLMTVKITSQHFVTNTHTGYCYKVNIKLWNHFLCKRMAVKLKFKSIVLRFENRKLLSQQADGENDQTLRTKQYTHNPDDNHTVKLTLFPFKLKVADHNTWKCSKCYTCTTGLLTLATTAK